jgi:hypothetical protein
MGHFGAPYGGKRGYGGGGGKGALRIVKKWLRQKRRNAPKGQKTVKLNLRKPEKTRENQGKNRRKSANKAQIGNTQSKSEAKPRNSVKKPKINN